MKSAIDIAAIHWTGGVGMFALLEGDLLLGVLIVAIAQFMYAGLKRMRR